jgi:putative flippase GtrA
MRGLSFWPGLWAAIKADTLSLTAFEIGLFAWMALTYFVFFHPLLRPNQVEYWFMMQVGMLVGFVTAYPMNWWLIRVGIKENM